MVQYPRCIADLWDKNGQYKRELAELEATNRQLADERLKFRAQCKELIHAENALSAKHDQLIVSFVRYL